MISTKGLTRKFGELTAVDDLTLEVAEGEVLGFLGPNGAGKTTTIRMLSCLIAPTTGEATIGGFRIGPDNDAIRQMIGLLTETPGFYDKLSACRNLEFYADLYSVADVQEQVDKYLRLLDLWDRQHSPVAELSKGMKQKLALARALLHEPKVLFLDEPTSGLDPQAAKTVREFIQELSGRGRTIFLSTHNLAEAGLLCDRIAVFRQHLIALDSPDNLRQQLFRHKTKVQLQSLEYGLVSVVQALDFVHHIETEDNSLIITLSAPEKHTPDLVERIVSCGGRIQMVREVEHSLEDIYTTLLREEIEAEL